MSDIEWCKKQRNGIKLIDPSDNLSVAYLSKAEDALETMNSITSHYWIISTGYYAMYYSLYAVLMKAGIKSEIHTCTIGCMDECFEKYFDSDDVDTIENARIQRVQSQYYTIRESGKDEVAGIIKIAPVFHLKCRHICGMIKPGDIEEIREIVREK
ncbi:MAG: HEPN domain-containing protein [Methanomicrobiaceae archaeon]|nr:HEPN domain-containing protein [Methanomicrobiaceae archaeon]